MAYFGCVDIVRIESFNDNLTLGLTELVCFDNCILPTGGQLMENETGIRGSPILRKLSECLCGFPLWHIAFANTHGLSLAAERTSVFVEY